MLFVCGPVSRPTATNSQLIYICLTPSHRAQKGECATFPYNALPALFRAPLPHVLNPPTPFLAKNHVLSTLTLLYSQVVPCRPPLALPPPSSFSML